MFKSFISKSFLLIFSFTILNSCFAGTNEWFLNQSVGVRNASTLQDNDKYSSVLRSGLGILWPVNVNNNYFKKSKLGVEFAGVTGFSGRNAVLNSFTGLVFMPLNYNFSDSLDLLAKGLSSVNNFNVVAAVGANFSVMKPMNAIMATKSKFRTAPKFYVGLERNLSKNWTGNVLVHYVFNSYGGDPVPSRTFPFTISGFVAQTMATVGVEYRDTMR